VELRLVVGQIGVLLLSGEVTIGEPGDAGPRLEPLEGVLKPIASRNFLEDLVNLEIAASFPVLAVGWVGVVSSSLRARLTRTPPLEIPALGVGGEVSIFEGKVRGARERQPSVSEPEMVLGLLSAFFLVSQAEGTGAVVVCFLLIAPLDLMVGSRSTEPSQCSSICREAGTLLTLDGGMNNSATFEASPP
jgi:hypothetical protein